MVHTLFALISLVTSPNALASAALIDSASTYEDWVAEFTPQELDQEVYAIPLQIFDRYSAPGKEIEPVSNTTNLRLLGRGIAPRRGRGESLAIACYRPGPEFKFKVYNTDCPTVRFVWFKSPREAFYIGETIGMPGTETAQLRKKALKAVLRDFFNRHQTPASEKKIRQHLLRSFIMIVGVSAVVTLSLPTTAAGTVIVGWSQAWKLFAIPIGLFYLSTNVAVEDCLVSGTLIDAQLTDENGWNWAGKPKIISQNNFRTIREQIVDGRRINDDHFNKEAKIRRIYDRLSRKGVEISRPVGF